MADQYYGYTRPTVPYYVVQRSNDYVPQTDFDADGFVTKFNDGDKSPDIEIMWRYLQGEPAEQVSSLAGAWERARDLLEQMSEHLRRHADALSAKWRSEAGRAFLREVGAALSSIDEWKQVAADNATGLRLAGSATESSQNRFRTLYQEYLDEQRKEDKKREDDSSTDGVGDWFGDVFTDIRQPEEVKAAYYQRAKNILNPLATTYINVAFDQTVRGEKYKGRTDAVFVDPTTLFRGPGVRPGRPGAAPRGPAPKRPGTPTSPTPPSAPPPNAPPGVTLAGGTAPPAPPPVTTPPSAPTPGGAGGSPPPAAPPIMSTGGPGGGGGRGPRPAAPSVGGGPARPSVSGGPGGGSGPGGQRGSAPNRPNLSGRGSGGPGSPGTGGRPGSGPARPAAPKLPGTTGGPGGSGARPGTRSPSTGQPTRLDGRQLKGTPGAPGGPGAGGGRPGKPSSLDGRMQGERGPVKPGTKAGPGPGTPGLGTGKPGAGKPTLSGRGEAPRPTGTARGTGPALGGRTGAAPPTDRKHRRLEPAGDGHGTFDEQMLGVEDELWTVEPTGTGVVETPEEHRPDQQGRTIGYA